MGVRVFISGISGNKEVKKRQQRVCMILDSKHIPYEVIDITEPGKESDKEFMQQNSNAGDTKHPLPPQIFNDETYCGDYDQFELANENDELEKFLKVPASSPSVENGHVANGNTSSRETSAEKEGGDQQVPESPESQPAEDSEMVVDNNQEPVKEETEVEATKDAEEESEEEEE